LIGTAPFTNGAVRCDGFPARQYPHMHRTETVDLTATETQRSVELFARHVMPEFANAD